MTTLFKKVLAVMLSVLCLASLAGCSKSGTNSSGGNNSGSTSHGIAPAEQVGDTAFAEEFDALKNAKLGDTITGRGYLIGIQDGIKTYYIHGRYVLVDASNGMVFQIRDELELANAAVSVGEIIRKDEDFDLDKATVTFFSADGSQVQGTLEDGVNAITTDCVVEYAEWDDETEKSGKVQSYLFTYGTVAMKITGYYVKDDTSSDNTSSGATSIETSDISGETSLNESNASTSSGVSEGVSSDEVSSEAGSSE